MGFAVWERRSGNGRNVTFPARQYSVNGERRSFALLRPIADATAQDRLRDLILQAYREHEEQLVRLSDEVVPTYRSIAISFAFSAARFGGSVHSSRRLLSSSLRKNVSFMPPSMMLHGSTLSLAAIAKHEEVRIDAGIGNRAAPIAAIASAASIAGATRRSPSDNSAW